MNTKRIKLKSLIEATDKYDLLFMNWWNNNYENGETFKWDKRKQLLFVKDKRGHFMYQIPYSDLVRDVGLPSNSKLVFESIDVPKKYTRNDEQFIASNESYWQWEYDTSTNHALLFMKANGDLRLTITNEHIKSGIGKGEFYKELESEMVGTVRKPDIARIKNLVKKHGHKKTRAGGPFKSQWFDVINQKVDLLTNIIKQYL